MELDVRVGIGLLVAAITVAVAAKRVNVPYNIALVIGGMLVALTGVLPSAPRLEPEIVFVICLPALLFEGGISADLRSIRADAAPILLLAVLGMIVSIATTGVLFSLLLDFPWIAGLLLGAAMSATDTVAVLYAFRRVPVPPRLSGLVQGESLFNDGTALVAYSTLAAIAVGGVALTPTVIATKLVAVTLGGAAVGVALALGAGVLVRWTEDPLTEIMVTTALAFAAYVAAEELHLSGAIAAVAAGLTMGATVRRTSSPPAQVAISSFWEYVAFGVNTLLFLLVGLSTRPDSIVAHLPETGVAVLCVFAGRAAGIYGPSALWNVVARDRAIPLKWQSVFVVGNIKGAISIALALGLPATIAGREQMVDVAFGVTFVSLVGQGLLLTGVLRRMGLFTTDPIADEIAAQQAKLLGARAARQELEVLHTQGLVPKDGYERLRSEYQVVIAGAERELRRLHERHLAHGARLLLATRRRLIDAERTALFAARRAGVVPDTTAEHLLAELDARLLSLEERGRRQEEKG